MKFQDPQRIAEFANALATSSKEALGMLSAAVTLNKEFPRGNPLTTQQMVSAANILREKSADVLTLSDSLNIVKVLYDHKSTVKN